MKRYVRVEEVGCNVHQGPELPEPAAASGCVPKGIRRDLTCKGTNIFYTRSPFGIVFVCGLCYICSIFYGILRPFS
jgi:hypothetical protein